MRIDTYKCDQCGAQKKEANHWYEGYLLGSPTVGVQVIQWGSPLHTGEVHTPSPENADAHLCGAACVSQWVSQNLLK